MLAAAVCSGWHHTLSCRASDITPSGRTSSAWKQHAKAQARMYSTHSKCTNSTEWTHVGSSTAEGEGGHNTTHLPHTELTSFNPLKAASRFVVPKCQIMHNSTAIMTASIHILPSSLWEDFPFSLFQGLISLSLYNSVESVLPFFSKWFGIDASTTGFRNPGYLFILCLYNTQHNRSPLHTSKF